MTLVLDRPESCSDSLVRLHRLRDALMAYLCTSRLVDSPVQAELIIDQLAEALLTKQIDGIAEDAYFFVAVKNRALNIKRGHARKKAFEERLGRELASIPHPDALVGLERSQLSARVQRALDTLEQDHVDVIRLKYFEDMSVPEIAQQLSIPEGTVTSRLTRARGFIRQCFPELELENV